MKAEDKIQKQRQLVQDMKNPAAVWTNERIAELFELIVNAPHLFDDVDVIEPEEE